MFETVRNTVTASHLRVRIPSAATTIVRDEHFPTKGRGMGRWVYQDQIDETLGWFVGHALPDAQPGWEELPWRVEEMGRTDDRGLWWTVAVDIPTSVEGMDCWLSFRVVDSGDEVRDACVDEVYAVRSGRGEHEYDVYVWDDREDMWVTAPEDDEEEDE